MINFESIHGKTNYKYIRQFIRDCNLLLSIVRQLQYIFLTLLLLLLCYCNTTDETEYISIKVLSNISYNATLPHTGTLVCPEPNIVAEDKKRGCYHE